MKKYFLLNLFMLLVWLTHAQDIHLVHESKTRVIKTGSYIELEIQTNGQQPCESCGGRFVTGKFLDFQDEQVKIQIMYEHTPLTENGKIIGSNRKKYSKVINQPVESFSIRDIWSIVQKGKHHLRERTIGKTLGGTLFLLGGATLLGGALAKGEENDKTLVLAGLSEVVLGIAIGSSSDQRKFITNLNCGDLAHENRLLWEFK